MRAIKIIIVLLTILVLSPIIAQETKPNQTSDNYDSHKEDPEPTSMLKKVKDILSRNYDNDTTGLHSMFGVTSLASFQEIPPGRSFPEETIILP